MNNIDSQSLLSHIHNYFFIIVGLFFNPVNDSQYKIVIFAAECKIITI